MKSFIFRRFILFILALCAIFLSFVFCFEEVIKMNMMVSNQLGVALMLRDFCTKCPYGKACENSQKKCGAIEFAEFLIDKVEYNRDLEPECWG